MKQLISKLALAFSTGAIMACLPVASAQYGQNSYDKITLYDFWGFSGNSKTYNGETPQLDQWGLDDRADSVRIEGGEWLLCQDVGYAGPCIVVRADIRELDDYGMGDKISSVRPLPYNINLDHGTVFSRDYSGNFIFYEADFHGNLEPVQTYGNNYGGNYGGSGYGQSGYNQDPYQGPRDPDVIVYTDDNYGGASLGLNKDIRSLRDFDFDNRISSIEIRSGDWEFCTNTYFNGTCEILDADELRLRDFGLNDNISSIRQVPTGTARQAREEEERRIREAEEARQKALRESAVVIFEHGNYKGRAEPVNGNVPNLKDLRMNDNISSIIIRSGSWQICDGPNYQGRCETISANTPKLNGIRLNDNISSIRKTN